MTNDIYRMSTSLWDGRNQSRQAAASGLYVYQLRAGGKTFTRKMALLR